MKEETIPPLNLFLMCRRPDPMAFRTLPEGIRFRTCGPEELGTWKILSAGDPQYRDFMTGYYNKVYAPRSEEFSRRCTFACREDGTPVGTCFLWKAYGRINTLHWFRVLPKVEGRGIGRALLTHLLRDLDPRDLPVYLHTHPSSYRAVKLYSDFGFELLSGAQVGFRKNDLEESLPYLRKYMPPEAFARLRITQPEPELLEAALETEYEQF